MEPFVGKSCPDILKQNFILGLLMDKGVVDLAKTNGKTAAEDLNCIGQRFKNHDDVALFLVLRYEFKQSLLATIDENVDKMAACAVICQENGLVPILQPVILADGSHNIEKCTAVAEHVLAALVKALNDYEVSLEGTVLSTNMVTPALKATEVSPKLVAEYTIRTLNRTIPPAIPSICLIAGLLSQDEAALCLNEIKLLNTMNPWSIFFSSRQGIEPIVFRTWYGKKEKVKKARLVAGARQILRRLVELVLRIRSFGGQVDGRRKLRINDFN